MLLLRVDRCDMQRGSRPPDDAIIKKERDPCVKLTIYLFRQEVQSLDGLLEDKYLTGGSAYKELTRTAPLPFGCRVYVQKTDSTPRWASYLAPAFSKEDLRLVSTMNSFIALLKVEHRVFALTFGYGCHAIKRSLVESRFGLKCTLNLTDPSKIRTLDTRNVDLVVKQQRTHVSVGSAFPDFEIDPLVDWVGYVAGRCPGGGVVNSIAGADSVSVTTTRPFEDLGGVCSTLLRAFESDNYKTRYPFIDYLTPVRQGEGLVATLDAGAADMLRGRASERISVAYPEMPDFERIDHLKISASCCVREMDDLSLSAVYTFLDEVGPQAEDPRSIYILPLDANGDPVMHRYSLWDFLACEVEHGGLTYVLSLGRWFLVDNGFMSRLRQEIDKIPDLTEQMAMPEMLGREREAEYNLRVANLKGWLLLDRKMIEVADRYGKVEVCDLVTTDMHFVGVKKMSSSATLSHLFMQGLVSAKLLRSDQDYERSVRGRILEQWPGKAPTSAIDPVFVFAVATEKDGPLADALFLFSRIGLVEQTLSMRQVGYRVGICKIRKCRPSVRAHDKRPRGKRNEVAGRIVRSVAMPDLPQ